MSRVAGMTGIGLVATAALLGLPGTAAAAVEGATGGTVVVRGTAFPDPRSAGLSLTGCAAMTAPAPAPRTALAYDPDAAPWLAGESAVTPGMPLRRSLELTPAGPGGAAGAGFTVPSLAGTTAASVDVHAPFGTSGVAYAGYQEATDRGTQQYWVGRADVSVAGGTWQRVDATGLSYAWAKIDLTTGQRVAAGPAAATVASFAARSGGGGGFYSVGFGCDGAAFTIDRLQVGAAGGVRTYDIEGMPSRTTIAGPARVAEGKDVRLTGSVSAGAALSQPTLALEERVDGVWRKALTESGEAVVVTGAQGAVTVTPERTTAYRFRFGDRPAAEGSVSAPLVVEVGPKDEAAGKKDKAKDKAEDKNEDQGNAGQPAPAQAEDQQPAEPQPAPAEQPAPVEPQAPEPKPERTPEPKPEPTPPAPEPSGPATPSAPATTPPAGPGGGEPSDESAPVAPADSREPAPAEPARPRSTEPTPAG